jgi:hypothetical protein
MINTIQEKLQELVEQRYHSEDANDRMRTTKAVLRLRLASGKSADYSQLPFKYISGLNIENKQYKVKRSNGVVENNWHFLDEYMEKDMSDANDIPHVYLHTEQLETKKGCFTRFLMFEP